MIPLTLGELSQAVGGRVLSGKPDTMIAAVSVDSRRISRGDLFVPITGERYDGHDFIDAAMSGGAGGFLTAVVDGSISSWLDGGKAAVVRVEDTTVALSRLAGFIRGRLSARVVGVTGSTGKTSTKDMLAAIAGHSFAVQASPKNYNNEIGVPLTLTKAKLETEVLIVEMGMRGLGQIAQLADIARPEIGVVTNIGLTHIGLLGSREQIARAKSELLAALPEQGCAILNYDDEWISYLRKNTRAAVVTFGLDPRADICADNLTLDDDALPGWRLVIRGKPGPEVKLSVPGRHNITNALAAVAAAKALGIGDRDIVLGLSRVRLSDMRLNVFTSSAGVKVINDTYNANPASMAAALDTLVEVKTPARRIAVLGLMAELGPAATAAYRSVGTKIALLPIDLLITVGDEASAMAKAAVAAGMSEKRVVESADKQEAADLLDRELRRGDIVLIKGSRSAALESIADRLAGEN